MRAKELAVALRDKAAELEEQASLPYDLKLSDELRAIADRLDSLPARF
jgi:hypothetical protein